MKDKLGTVEKLIQDLRKRHVKAQYLARSMHQLQKLDADYRSQLEDSALADNRARGQWGERIAEDIS